MHCSSRNRDGSRGGGNVYYCRRSSYMNRQKILEKRSMRQSLTAFLCPPW